MLLQKQTAFAEFSRSFCGEAHHPTQTATRDKLVHRPTLSEHLEKQSANVQVMAAATTFTAPLCLQPSLPATITVVEHCEIDRRHVVT